MQEIIKDLVKKDTNPVRIAKTKSSPFENRCIQVTFLIMISIITIAMMSLASTYIAIHNDPKLRYDELQKIFEKGQKDANLTSTYLHNLDYKGMYDLS